ncbi:DUF1840 domain-containing protein [Vibrio sp. CAU 1672]|uniref:DUF1840 domain-containing protein n=1 Tax=Vibrio sp. CAU 1672 TaxID=3032594 RepID=UPI0023D9C646|nr:DUF1840 domain-containing protein [Vibrio sp. CAU 1672]MDF2153085.1 DUF1840 domain-containing protein [Vibrio sp. CAU 1672]
MLITFHCKAYANVTMFGEVGLQMLSMMGHSETVPGAILAPDVPEALNKLKAAIDKQQRLSLQAEAEPEQDEDDDDVEQAVSMANRAFPLIELLTAAAKEECDVMWDEE